MAGSSRSLRTNKTVTGKPNPLRKFSQNFLTDKATAKKIVDALELTSTDVVIEIGPGTGALTQWLVKSDAAHIIAVDVDARSLDHITIEPWFIKKKISTLNKSILDVDPIEFASMSEATKVIGNIPYGITSDILFWMFEHRTSIQTSVITMQREVAKRCVATVGTKDYGILSIATWFCSDAKLLFNISPGSFFPKPDVTSSVVRFKHIAARDTSVEFGNFMKYVRAAFSQRRKLLSNSLISWASLRGTTESIKTKLDTAGYSKSRAEELTPPMHLDLFKQLTTDH